MECCGNGPSYSEHHSFSAHLGLPQLELPSALPRSVIQVISVGVVSDSGMTYFDSSTYAHTTNWMHTTPPTDSGMQNCRKDSSRFLFMFILLACIRSRENDLAAKHRPDVFNFKAVDDILPNQDCLQISRALAKDVAPNGSQRQAYQKSPSLVHAGTECLVLLVCCFFALAAAPTPG